MFFFAQMFYESCRSNQPIKGEVHWELSKCLLKKRPELESVSYKDANSHHLGHQYTDFWMIACHSSLTIDMTCLLPSLPTFCQQCGNTPHLFYANGCRSKKNVSASYLVKKSHQALPQAVNTSVPAQGMFPLQPFIGIPLQKL